MNRGQSLDLRLGLATWGAFMLATCAYCLVYQAFVAAITPDPARTLALALREWGAWAVLAPWALTRFRRPLAWRDALLFCVPLALVAAALPVVADVLAGERGASASLALFWPRNLAMAVGLYVVARALPPAAPRDPAHVTTSAGSAATIGEPIAAPPSPPRAAPRTLLVSKGASQCLIRVDDIQHLSAAGNYVEIRAADQDYLLRSTMGELESLLPAGDFVRIHRSHIVRVRDIEGIRVARSGSGTVRLRGGAELAISKSYRAQLKAGLH